MSLTKPCVVLFLALAGLFVNAADKPNILMIAIDDQNDWIGFMGGHPNAKTPHIDALAASGTAFTNAHCQSPLCNPSRTSLMVSKRPGSTGIYGLKPWFRDVAELADLETLPQFLMRNGYKTYTAGKIYHGRYGKKDGGNGTSLGQGPVESRFHPRSWSTLLSLTSWSTGEHLIIRTKKKATGSLRIGLSSNWTTCRRTSLSSWPAVFFCLMCPAT